MSCKVLFLLCAAVCAHAHRTHTHTHTHAHAHAHAHGTASTQITPDEPVTVTPSGVIRGSWMETRRGRRFEAYRGIRYAEPPVGKLRFQPPKLIEHYDYEVDAREEGPACPQPSETPGFIVDEDCLRINVYTPGKNVSKPLPVILFLHPGGFYSVSGRSDVAGPHYLLEKDIVFVTINYRLATLGFLSTGDELAPGNNGFKDQVIAMRWIQRNIRAFGGDPNLVTLAGYSAGSLSIGLHMVSPMTKGLFHRAISMSASPLSQVVIGPHQKHLAVRQARIFGCQGESSQEILDCLRSKTAKELGDSLDKMFEFGYDPILLWNVVIEPDFGQERFLTMQPLDAIKQGKMHAVPYIVSQTTDEFFWKAFNIQANDTLLNTMNSEWERIAPISFMLPEKDSAKAAARLKEAYLDGKPVGKDKASAAALGKLYSDSVIGFAAHRMANVMCRHSPHKVYFYEFAYFGNHSHYEDGVTGKPVGAAHHDDMLYLFTLTVRFPVVPLDSPDSTIVDRMTAIFYNFARYGDPNPQPDTPELTGLSWPAMTAAEQKYLRIGKEFSVHEKLFEDRYKVWDELYPIQY